MDVSRQSGDHLDEDMKIRGLGMSAAAVICSQGQFDGTRKKEEESFIPCSHCIV